MQMSRLLMISTHGYVATKPRLGMPDTGGQVVYVLELSKALAACGFKVDILTRGFEDQKDREEVAKNVEIVRVKYAGPQFIPKEKLANHTSELMTKFFEQADRRHDEYRVVLSHYWDAGVAGTAVSRRLGIPHGHIPHSLGLLKRQNCAWGSTGESGVDHLDERIKSERAIYHHADLVVATAREQTQCLRESDEYNVPESTVVQIPAGINDGVFFPVVAPRRYEAMESLGWKGRTVLCAGRLDRSKGYDLMVRAFPAVLARVPDARLVLAVCNEKPTAKEQSFLGELMDLADELGIAERVVFCRCVDQRRLADYYRSADVFVLCSRNEPFGMTAIEAMACGTATVLTTRGGLWEEMTWGRDCIYCDPTDVDALSQAVCNPLLHSRVRDQLVQGGAATASSRYTWSKIAERILQHLETRNLLSTRSNRRMVISYKDSK